MGKMNIFELASHCGCVTVQKKICYYIVYKVFTCHYSFISKIKYFVIIKKKILFSQG